MNCPSAFICNPPRPGSGLSLASSDESSPPFRRFFDADLRFFFRSRWMPERGSMLSSTVQYAPFPRSVSGRETFLKQGFRERLWRTEFC